MRRRHTAILAAVVVVALGGAGAAWALNGRGATGSALIVGFYRPTDALALSNRTIVAGTYRIEYGAEVQFFSRVPGASLECGLVDASGRIGYIDDTTYSVPPTGAWTRIGDSATYEVPEITLGVRCTPTVSGSLGVGYRNLAVTAARLR